jgi:hypothetical protein
MSLGGYLFAAAVKCEKTAALPSGSILKANETEITHERFPLVGGGYRHQTGND